jgi:mitogen-activated protein kinase kinase kinase 13
LLRLRKDELVRLYSAAGLAEDAEHFTKQDLAEAIVSARDDVAEVPPSSPSGFTSSDGSSDDGHFAGDEETDAGTRFPPSVGSNGLRRRVTVQTLGSVSRGRPNATGRTMSLSHLEKPSKSKASKYSNGFTSR